MGNTSTGRKILSLPAGRKEEIARKKFKQDQLAAQRRNAEQSPDERAICCSTTQMGYGDTRLSGRERSALKRNYAGGPCLR